MNRPSGSELGGNGCLKVERFGLNFVLETERDVSSSEFIYNHRRPHSALRYLRSVDYYRGDPRARLAERTRKLQHALVGRQTYWKAREDHTEAAGG